MDDLPGVSADRQARQVERAARTPILGDSR